VNWYFIFFLISGFCSVLYELVWLRLAMAQFGVTTAMVSIVLSVFMAGLGLGSWASGRWLDAPGSGSRVSALRVYALIELLIGASGLVVPFAFLWGRHVLERYELSSALGYYGVAGVWVGISVIPGCTLMGATVPVAMRAIAQTIPAETRRSFSYLYTANVAGAVAGTYLPLFLIELLGFRGTLKVGMACNCLITLSALALSRRWVPTSAVESLHGTPSPAGSGDNKILALLFLSGLTCMAMEVVWVRSYTPYFGTVVYAFASILGVYLLGTFIGSVVYRRWSSRRTTENPVIWAVLAFCGLLPLVAASPAVHMSGRLVRLLVGVAGFTGLLGFITPMLVDRFSAGDSGKAGTAYATNVVGCILGPLLAGFGLLPLMSERWALMVLALPWLIVGLAPLRRRAHASPAAHWAIYALLAFSALLVAVGKDYEARFLEYKVLRDPTATVTATGTGMDKKLLVNGYGMTNLTPITKVMAHLPMAFPDHRPQDALVICFGMGTTFRSLRSWGIPVTAVELVPSVPRLFSYYHSDAAAVLASPLARVVIDDGRRYLERARQPYDLITVDPPPPLQAAGSSLLYSEEFYRLARQRLRPGGILQQWVPANSAGDPVDVASIAGALRNSFPYVRAFPDEFGIHFLCSDQPIPLRSAKELLNRMPKNAVADLTEWDSRDASIMDAAYFRLNALLTQEIPVDQLIAASPNTPSLTDDRPINEYYVLRRWYQRRFHTGVVRR
jgi:predicted membrane-bound spermidine synthase